MCYLHWVLYMSEYLPCPARLLNSSLSWSKSPIPRQSLTVTNSLPLFTAAQQDQEQWYITNPEAVFHVLDEDKESFIVLRLNNELVRVIEVRPGEMFLQATLVGFVFLQLHTLFTFVLINRFAIIVFARLILPSKCGPLRKIKMCSFLGGSYFSCDVIHVQKHIIWWEWGNPLSIFSDTYTHFVLLVGPYLSFFFFFLSVSFLFSLVSFFVFPPLAVSCLDKLMYKSPLAPHHGWLPYQGQESALQHLQHFISLLSECRGRRGNKPVG